MKRMLITGAQGLLGSACMREFGKDHELFTQRIPLQDIQYVREAFDAFRPEIVIHCAAKVGGVKANRDHPVEFLLDNLTMQNNVISVAAASGVQKLCFIATSCMFPKDAELPVQESSLFTGKLEDSVEAYAIAKIAGWRLCKAYWEQQGKKFITVAPSNIYGLNDHYGEQAHVIPALIRKFHQAVASEQPMEVWGDGTAIREFIYADDVASAIRICLESWDSPEIVNIGTGVGSTIAELVHHLKFASPYLKESWPKIIWNDSQPTGIPRKTFSIEKLTRLGWKPQVSLKEGLQRTWHDFYATMQHGTTRGLEVRSILPRG